MLTEEQLNKKNLIFYKVLDFFCIVNRKSRAKITKLAGLSYGGLNKSKTSEGRWVGFGVFLKICDALEIRPIDFLQKMSEFENNEKKGDK